MNRARFEIMHSVVNTVVVLALLVWGAQALTFGGSPDKCAAEERRPYDERNLVEEYGWDVNEPAPGGGPLDYMKIATRANRYRNILSAESSRIQMELESNGHWFVDSLECDRLAAQRLADQGIVPPATDGD